MTPPASNAEKLILAMVVLLSLAAIAATALQPGYSHDNTSVYQGF